MQGLDMKLTLQRYEAAETRTFGKMLAEDGHRLCYVLEDKIREIDGQPVSAWKVHGKTAIPQGEYRITLENSPRFGPDTLTVNSVPGFAGVRMHAGNTEGDTEGCPLLGMEVNPDGIMGGTSRPAVSLIKQLVQQAISRGEVVLMRVTNP